MKKLFLILVTLISTNGFSQVGVSVFDPNPNVFDNPITNEEEMRIFLSETQDLLTSYSWAIMVSEIASDNSLKGGDSMTDFFDLLMIDEFQHNPYNYVTQDIWNFLFAGYNRASFAYEKGIVIPNIPPRYLAEALFLKAFYSYNIIEWFGHHPQIMEYDEDNNPFLSPSSIYESPVLLDSILYFLDEAISITTINGVSSSGRTAIDKNTMLAFKAKTYMKLEDYPGVNAVTNEIISNGPYFLTSNYQDIFDYRTPSSIFDIDCTDNEYASWQCLLCSQGNLMSGFQGIRIYDGPEFESGYGFNIPTQESYDSFDSGDIRREIAILDISEWTVQNPTVFFIEGYNHSGYFNKKYLPRQGGMKLPEISLTYGNDLKVIRYAEILLLAAESSLMMGNNNVAVNYLNQVRNRAGLSGISPNDINMDHIIEERRSEFMGEGKRFFDLIHFDKASEIIPNFETGKHEVFPIPQSFIDLANTNDDNIIMQNPGYATSLSVSNINNLTFNVYPNPTSNFLNVSLSQTLTNPKIEMYDVQGRKVLSNLLKPSKSLDISDLKPAIYFYIIKDGKEFKYTGKIIKQ
tara:strand:- start:2266 stop:3990 length:1725 start_codon:yes stop_codon:yes gene_type:complete